MFTKDFHYQLGDLKHGIFTYYPCFLDYQEANALYEDLKDSVNWQTQTIKLYGESVVVPRLVSFYGDVGVEYTYSGVRNIAAEWLPALWIIKNQIEYITRHHFNSVLLNYYRNGKDSVSYHSDDESHLGENPTVASLSLGAERAFNIKDKTTNKVFKIKLTNGSLLVMGDKSQLNYTHALPKDSSKDGRINLTFRRII